MSIACCRWKPVSVWSKAVISHIARSDSTRLNSTQLNSTQLASGAMVTQLTSLVEMHESGQPLWSL